MTNKHKFDPDWVIAPGETLREWMADNNMSPRVLAAACGVPRDLRDMAARNIEDILNHRPLTEAWAGYLECGTGISAKFWMAYEHNYRAGLAAGKTDAST